MTTKYKESLHDVLAKLAAIDTIIQSLGAVHEDHGDKRDELFKKYSERKLQLMDEAFKLVSTLAI